MLFVNSSDLCAIIYARKAILCLKYKAMLASISSFTMFTSETHIRTESAETRGEELILENMSEAHLARNTPGEDN